VYYKCLRVNSFFSITAEVIMVFVDLRNSWRSYP